MKLIRRAIEDFRTAPIGFSVMASGLLWPAYYAVEGGPNITDLASLPMTVMHVAMGSLAVSAQFRLRERLENFVERHGYSEEAFSTTTREWCARQTARIVCQKYGLLERYEELCDRQIDSQDFRRLPHI